MIQGAVGLLESTWVFEGQMQAPLELSVAGAVHEVHSVFEGPEQVRQLVWHSAQLLD